MQSMMHVRTQQLPKHLIFSTTQHVFCFSKHVNPMHSNTHVSYIPVFDPNTYKNGRPFFKYEMDKYPNMYVETLIDELCTYPR